MARTPKPVANAAATPAPTPPPAPAETPAPAPAETPPAETPAIETVDHGDLIEARALIAFGEYDADDLVCADADAIEALEREGKVDSDPAAVAFAKSLQEG